MNINDSLAEIVRQIRAHGGPPVRPAKGTGTFSDGFDHVSSEPIPDEEIEEYIDIIYADRREAGKALPPQ